jgi:hypothetical protein
MANRISFQPARLSEVSFLSQPFDFVAQLAIGETISTQAVTASVYQGTDPNPAALIHGAAAVQNITQVVQMVAPLVLGVIYELLCTVTTSLGQTLKQSGYLAVIPDLL